MNLQLLVPLCVFKVNCSNNKIIVYKHFDALVVNTRHMFRMLHCTWQTLRIQTNFKVLLSTECASSHSDVIKSLMWLFYFDQSNTCTKWGIWKDIHCLANWIYVWIWTGLLLTNIFIFCVCVDCGIWTIWDISSLPKYNAWNFNI